ncbi:hypothetical protein OUZ56_007982 [Daphnia magna]|uniref:Uncharacterized protein n=1 Tax=Daphnia magna TaxID=35525 RepID=A0ABR0ABK1_9CRUS|nr:hypothetical protein OUZ56_007982 [Daphnia magna]
MSSKTAVQRRFLYLPSALPLLALKVYPTNWRLLTQSFVRYQLVQTSHSRVLFVSHTGDIVVVPLSSKSPTVKGRILSSAKRAVQYSAKLNKKQPTQHLSIVAIFLAATVRYCIILFRLEIPEKVGILSRAPPVSFGMEQLAISWSSSLVPKV